MDVPGMVVFMQVSMWLKATAGCCKLLFPQFAGLTAMLGLLQDHSPQCAHSTPNNRPQSPPFAAPRTAKPLHYSDNSTFRDVTRLLSKKVPVCPPTAIKVIPATRRYPRDIKHSRELTLDSLAYRFMERDGCLGFGTVPGSKVQQHKEVDLFFSLSPSHP